MKKAIFTILIFLLPALLFAQWAKSVGGTYNDNAWSIGVDGIGNTYISGNFEGTVDFDPGPGSYNLTNDGLWDIFIAKYSPTGAFVWAKTMGGTLFSGGRALSMAVENNGNVYITGELFGTVDFDPGSGTFNLIDIGNGDAFFAKYTTDGNLVWAKNVGGTLADNGSSIAFDLSGNVYVTGEFSASADFDPTAGIFNLTGYGSKDVFIAKYASDGSFIWAQNVGGTSRDGGNSVSVDGNGNIYVAGSFQGTADFDPGTSTFNLISNGEGDIFVAKYAASGNFIWAKGIGGSTFESVYNLSVDANGNTYYTGYFQGTVDFDPGTGTFHLISNGSYDIFIAKLSSDGNFVWANNFGSASADIGYSVTNDVIGNIFVAGYFSGTIDFDPGASTFNLTSAGNSDIFFVKLTSGGSFVWAKNVGGTSYETASSIKVDGIGNIFITGGYSGIADFDPGIGTLNLTSSGGLDLFIAKYGSDGSLQNVNAEIKIFLEGPYISSSMNSNLSPSIPLSQPYGGSPWNYNGGESTTTNFLTTNNIVDWVYIELRTGSSAANATNVVSRRAALLRNDGVIIDPDGTTAIDFSGIGSGNYFIAVYHRNHLQVISSSTVSF